MIKKLDEYIDGIYSYITSLDALKFYENEIHFGSNRFMYKNNFVIRKDEYK